LVLELFDPGDFAKAAAEAGAGRAYLALKLRATGRGMRVFRARLVLTALGCTEPLHHPEVRVRVEGRPLVLRFEHDFGPAPEDPAARWLPEEYRRTIEAVRREAEEACERAGLEVRPGELRLW